MLVNSGAWTSSSDERVAASDAQTETCPPLDISLQLVAAAS